MSPNQAIPGQPGAISGIIAEGRDLELLTSGLSKIGLKMGHFHLSQEKN